MDDKPDLAKSSRRMNWRKAGWIIVGLVVVVSVGFGALLFYSRILLEPVWARSLGLRGPLTTETESPRLMEGFAMMHFEGDSFMPCEEYKGTLIGSTAYALGWKDAGFGSRFQKLADSQGKNIYTSYIVYIRFTGQRSWLNNAGIFEGYGSNGLYKKAVLILDLLELQPDQGQCQK